MPPPTPLSIKTSSVLRLIKEEASYHKETIQQKAAVEKLELEGADEYDLRQPVRPFPIFVFFNVRDLIWANAYLCSLHYDRDKSLNRPSWWHQRSVSNCTPRWVHWLMQWSIPSCLEAVKGRRYWQSLGGSTGVRKWREQRGGEEGSCRWEEGPWGAWGAGVIAGDQVTGLRETCHRWLQ